MCFAIISAEHRLGGSNLKSASESVLEIAVTLLLVVFIGTLATAAQPQRFGRTVAGITVGQDNVAKVRSLYGPGAENTTDHILTLCYHFVEDDAYLSVSTFEQQNRVRSITLTTLADVTPGCHDASVKGKSPSGPSSVRLGDSMQKVIAAIGKPLNTGKLQAGDRELEYADYAIAGGHATCQFKGGKLIIISIELD
jgi:hypothetical protein